MHLYKIKLVKKNNPFDEIDFLLFFQTVSNHKLTVLYSQIFF